MDDTPNPIDARTLKFLRILVTTLTATMIIGLLVIIALFVIKFSETRPPLPERIALPDGVKAVAFTQAETWYAVVTDDNRILIYSPSTGTLLQEVEVTAEE
ncbi:DUF6476 family protein [Alisedimentitalea sp. MJ-SS2]|uniref:DUF6476 family protein n=1 Tax=Aliisedimentitalea sp. MJ-SS2 TaxID=3049795 RepID=UPI002914A4CA|nr:DUF6476 family protein [Alisedimentitalea sp. MJ-SS2]MDU8926025.1 DUF6476 family protein [Alisedimentitalea sp. MJ-SS2]